MGRSERIFRRELCARKRRGEYINFLKMRNQNFSTSSPLHTVSIQLVSYKKESQPNIFSTAAYQCRLHNVGKLVEKLGKVLSLCI